MNTRLRQQRLQPRAGQRGVALLIALVLLVVITLVGLAAVGTTILQNKAASNQFDRQIAFQSAEAALRVGAANLPNDVWHDCQDGGVVCDANPFTNVPAGNVNTVAVTPASAGTAAAPASASSAGTTFTASAVAAMQPQFVTESLGTWTNPESDVGFGNTANSRNYGVQGQSSTAIYYRVTARSCDPAAAACDNRAIVTLQAVYKQG